MNCLLWPLFRINVKNVKFSYNFRIPLEKFETSRAHILQARVKSYFFDNPYKTSSSECVPEGLLKIKNFKSADLIKSQDLTENLRYFFYNQGPIAPIQYNYCNCKIVLQFYRSCNIGLQFYRNCNIDLQFYRNCEIVLQFHKICKIDLHF